MLPMLHVRTTSRRALLLVVLLCAGCRPPAVAPVQRPYAPPTAESLLQHLREHAARIKSLRVEAKVDYKAERERVKVTAAFIVEAPDHLRVEMDNTFVGNVATLATDGHAFELLDVRNNRYLVGDASPCNIARLLRVELRPADIIAVLGGGAPLPDGEAGESKLAAGWNPGEGGREVLTLSSAAGDVETLELSSGEQRWDLMRAELRRAGGVLAWRIQHDDYTDVDGVRLPGRSEVVQPARDADAKLRYKTRELNITVPPNAFSLTPPSGIPVERVRCD